jgi:hypothetical protein
VVLWLTACAPVQDRGKPSEATAPSAQKVDHAALVNAALTTAGINQKPQAIEMTDGGWLATTFELDNIKSETQAKTFAMKTLLAIRKDIYGENVAQNYRVTLNGPSPGPGLVLRYGAARFIEGVAEWKSNQGERIVQARR